MTNQQQEPTNIVNLYVTLYELCKDDILLDFTVTSYTPEAIRLYYQDVLVDEYTSAFDCIETARRHTKTFREVFA